MTSVQAEVRELSHFIGGEWVNGGGTFEDADPFTGETVASVAAGGREEAAQAVAAAGGGARLGGDPAARATASVPRGGRRARSAPRRGRLVACT